MIKNYLYNNKDDDKFLLEFLIEVYNSYKHNYRNHLLYNKSKLSFVIIFIKYITWNNTSNKLYIIIL